MANLQCPTALTCAPCPDGDPSNPNLSAEKPDLDSFFALVHYSDVPPLGGTWGASQCTQVFTSTISQQDADLKALAAAQECAWTINGGWHDPPTIGRPNGTQRQIFANSPASCQASCPDGTPFLFTLPGGLILSIISQDDADEKAHNYACKQARAQLMCLQAIDSFACQNQFFETELVAETGLDSFTTDSSWNIIAGALPDGLLLLPDPLDPFAASISGIPSVTGVFSFTVLILLGSGDSASKSYSITVGGIGTDSSLPDAPLGAEYSQALTTVGMAGTITWSVFLGPLPDGLTLDPVTGIISGTPTTAGNYAFTIQASNDA